MTENSPQTGLVAKLRTFLLKATVEQWAWIDQNLERRDESAHRQAYAAFVICALMLTIQRYFGGRTFFTEMMGTGARKLPYPELMPHLYWSAGCAATYFVIPALYLWIIRRESIGNFGWRFRGTLKHLPIYFGLFMVVFPLVIVASGHPSFLMRYPFYNNAANSWTELLTWEGAYALQFVTLEFFFRGFLLFALAPALGSRAIFAVAVPYCMIHFGKPVTETIGAIIAGITLGTLSLRTGSIAGGILIHVAVAWSMDLLALYREGSLMHLFR